MVKIQKTNDNNNNADDVEQLEFSYIVGRCVKWNNHLQILIVSIKAKYMCTF